jgi:hypothetical protein
MLDSYPSPFFPILSPKNRRWESDGDEYVTFTYLYSPLVNILYVYVLEDTDVMCMCACVRVCETEKFKQPQGTTNNKYFFLKFHCKESISRALLEKPIAVQLVKNSPILMQPEIS